MITDLLNIAVDQSLTFTRDLTSSAVLLGDAARYRVTARPGRALDSYAKLVTGSRAARESMHTYRLISRFLQRHDGSLDQPVLPDDQLPQKLLLFIGYSRSGHSLVGSLLDAHPQVCISHELHLLKHLRAGVSFAEACRAIKLNALLFERAGRAYSGYDYAVPGQHQGRYTRLTIAGDKKGNGTLRLLRRHPALLERLPTMAPVPLVFVHVIRNPFDNIATRARRKRVDLRHAARGYFANSTLVEAIKRRHPEAVIDVYLDDLIERPAATLAALLQRLGIDDVPEGYLQDCSSLIFRAPSRTQQQASWDPELRTWIRQQIAEHDFLDRFSG